MTITWHDHSSYADGEEWPCWHAHDGDRLLVVITREQVKPHLWGACTPDGKRIATEAELHMAKWKAMHELAPCACVSRALCGNLTELPPCDRPDCPHREQQPRRRPMAKKDGDEGTPVKLSEEEKQEHLVGLLRVEQKIDEVDGRKAKANNGWNAELKDLRKERAVHINALRTGWDRQNRQTEAFTTDGKEPAPKGQGRSVPPKKSKKRGKRATGNSRPRARA